MNPGGHPPRTIRVPCASENSKRSPLFSPRKESPRRCCLCRDAGKEKNWHEANLLVFWTHPKMSKRSSFSFLLFLCLREECLREESSPRHPLRTNEVSSRACFVLALISPGSRHNPNPNPNPNPGDRSRGPLQKNSKSPQAMGTKGCESQQETNPGADGGGSDSRNCD